MHSLIDPSLGLCESQRSKEYNGDEKLVERSVNNLEWTDSGSTLAVVEDARCPHHFSLPIQYFCLDYCNGEGCFCSECALTKHANCDVRTLREAHSVVISSVVCKWANQLAARLENLRIVFAQQLQDKREEWTTRLQESHASLYRVTNDMDASLCEMEASLVKWLSDLHQEFMHDLEAIKTKTMSVIDSYAKNATTLRQQRRLSHTDLLLFYNANYANLRQMLLGLTPRDSERVAQAECKHLKDKIEAMNKCALQVTETLAKLDQNIRNYGQVPTAPVSTPM
ncbi:hypothetical protein BdWA1_002883 [Babesia duncani]|uniref:B box-type domain-containing protein n=1 Tax=Babesia duncani TaxID=323732 RepID=A0AAD9PI93_9APIC|nr:hypothetical protein BdWA1_002883 [Babesia duncani]